MTRPPPQQVAQLIPDVLPATVHGTAVAHAGQSLLILGASGAGKSSLALQLMALGAGLVSDDLVTLDRCEAAIWAARPTAAPAPLQIEARGFGLMQAAPAPPAPVCLVVDLNQTEHNRLPEPCWIEIGGVRVRSCHKVDSPVFPAMLWHYLQGSNQPQDV